MPITSTNGEKDSTLATGVINRAVVRMNERTNVNFQRGTVGLAAENVTVHNAVYSAKEVPYATGMAIGNNYAGFYLFGPEKSPLHKALIFNPGPTAITVGYNVATSGGWTTQTGFPLASGDSIEFGGIDTTPVKNCWVKTAAQTNQIIYIQGFNQEYWI